MAVFSELAALAQAIAQGNLAGYLRRALGFEEEIAAADDRSPGVSPAPPAAARPARSPIAPPAAPVAAAPAAHAAASVAGPPTAGALRLTAPQPAPRPRVTESTAYLTRDEFVVMDVEGTAVETAGAMQAAVQAEGLPDVAVVMPGDARPAEGEVLEVLDTFDYTPSAGPNAGKKRRGLRFKASKALQSRLFSKSKKLKEGGLVLRDSLTREGRLLRRLRQPAFRQLQAAGRRPRWYAGVEIEVLGDDGRYYLVEFGAGDPLPKGAAVSGAGGHRGHRPPPAGGATAAADRGVTTANRFAALEAVAEEEEEAPAANVSADQGAATEGVPAAA